MVIGIAPAQGKFDYDADPAFLTELGAAFETQPEVAAEVLNAVHRILVNPFEPSIIRACASVNAKNSLFEQRIGTATLYWAVSTRNAVSLLNQDWRVKFLKLTIG